MSRIVDADDPIKTKHASKEYRENWDRIFGDDHPVYYAHPVWLYNTPLERDDVLEIERRFGTALNPNAPEHEAAYQARKASGGRGMDYFFEDVLPGCRLCVLRADVDGRVSAGAWSEAEWFRGRGLSVYEITTLHGIVVFDFNEDRRLSIEESRERCGK